MSDETGSADKQYEPTQRKLDEARRKGDLPRSADATGSAAMLGLTLVSALLGGGALLDLAGRLAAIQAMSGAGRGPAAFDTWAGMTAGTVLQALLPVLPWFIAPAALALAALFAQRAIVFAPDKVAPKASRISPVENAKNKFGLDGLFEFAKSTAKLLIFSGLLGGYLVLRLETIVLAVHLAPRAAVVTLLGETIRFIALITAIAVLIAAVDMIWQIASHQRKNRMSRKELQDEAKDTEGDPYLKQQRRERGVSIATNRMMAEVPKADVVIVNPSHYAVALSWDRTSPVPPVCVAKGVDEVALRIRSVAMESGVPVHRDPPTARALFATVDIGQPIAPDHYRAVAAAIRFADLIRKRARARR